MSEPQARQRFATTTGIGWDSTFEVVGYRNTHAGFTGDGEYAIILSAPSVTISRILASPPPFGETWRNGPVDVEIGYHCSFIYAESPVAFGIGTDHPEYSGGSDEVLAILSSKEARWCAKQRGPDSMPWHNGDLLIIEPSTNRVWLSAWDF